MAEHMTPVVAKVLPEEKAAFAAATQRVGTTPSNAIRMFIAAFNRCGTFPFDISPTGAFGSTGAFGVSGSSDASMSLDAFEAKGECRHVD